MLPRFTHKLCRNTVEYFNFLHRESSVQTHHVCSGVCVRDEDDTEFCSVEAKFKQMYKSETWVGHTNTVNVSVWSLLQWNTDISLFSSDPLHIINVQAVRFISSVYWGNSKNLVVWPFFFAVEIKSLSFTLFERCVQMNWASISICVNVKHHFFFFWTIRTVPTYHWK